MARISPTPGQKIQYLLCIFIGVGILYIDYNTDYFKKIKHNYKSFVRIEKFNDSSIDILVICFTSTKDWDKFLEIKEDLAIKIKDYVDKIGLNFAFPSTSIYIEKNESNPK